MKEGIQRMKPKTKDSGDSKKDINLLYFTSYYNHLTHNAARMLQ